MWIRRALQLFVRGVSLEWLLTERRSNGGDVVLVRAIGIATEICVFALVAKNIVDPKLGNTISFNEFRTQILEIAPWFAGAIGAVYAALYARFSSQWSYLAQLYNQIKQAEIELISSDTDNLDKAKKKLDEWKAGYIEDAQDLHLYAKSNVAAIIYFWGKDEAVKSAFISAAPGGHTRWLDLYRAACETYRRESISTGERGTNFER